MLALATHEPRFALLRDYVPIGRLRFLKIWLGLGLGLGLGSGSGLGLGLGLGLADYASSRSGEG